MTPIKSEIPPAKIIPQSSSSDREIKEAMTAISNSTTATFNGKKNLGSRCSLCDKKSDQIKRCDRCKNAFYCNKKCQVEHWPIHKTKCHPFTSYMTAANTNLREVLSTDGAQIHIAQTRALILQGLDQIPHPKTIVVCGAQMTKHHGFIEPLPELLEKCEKLILVDIDPNTLNQLHEKLGYSEKVELRQMDLIGLSKAAERFKAPSTSSGFIDEFEKFCDAHAGKSPKIALSEIKADYVISSLVCSEAIVRIQLYLTNLFSEKYGSFSISWEEIIRYGEAREALAKAVATGYVEQLQDWVHDDAIVYYADDKAEITHGQHMPRNESEIAVSILKNNRKTLTPIQKWIWNDRSCIREIIGGLFSGKELHSLKA